MRLAGSGTLATIYGDEGLSVILPNPMTNHPSFGSFKCFLGAGDFDFYMAKAGYTFETLTGVQGGGTMADQDADDVAISGGNATLNALTLTGQLGIGAAPPPSIQAYIANNKTSGQYAILVRAIGADTSGWAMVMQNVAGRDGRGDYV